MKKQFSILYALFVFVTFIKAQTIQYLPLYDDNTFTRPVNMNTNSAVSIGKTAGAVDVSGSGGASYGIPIALPPGTKGIVPSVAIGYNSQSGNGMMGMGWNVSAASAITRTGKNFLYDGAATAVNLDLTDLFALDGNRLELTSSSSYGQYGSTYATKMESFSKITLTGNGNFLVEGKNGMRYEYGNSADSQFKTEDNSKTISWYLNKSYDQYGNYIEYAYEMIGREMRIKEIRYTGNSTANILPYNKVKFNYLERADKKIMYASGASIAVNSLLSEIVVTTEAEQLVRRYKFNYAKDELNHSFLQEVVEFGSNVNDLPLNSTIFKYKKSNLAIMSKTSSVTLGAGFEIVGTGDYNGDGLSDIMAVSYNYHPEANAPVPREISALTTFLKNPNDNGYSEVPVTSFPVSTYASGYSIKYNTNTELPQAQDFDGDGKDDILIYFTSNIAGSGQTPIYTVSYNLYSFNGTQYAKWLQGRGGGRSGSLNYSGAEGNFDIVNIESQFATTGDFDGDGLLDIAVLLKDHAGSDMAKLVLIKPTKTTEAERSCIVESYFTASQPNSLLAASNIDGDSKQELILRFKNPYSYDGRVVTSLKPSTTSTPAVPKFQIEFLDGFYKNYAKQHSNFKLGDFNGDGNTDIVYKNTSGNSIYYEYSTGKNYITGGTIVFPSNMQDWDVGDFNGDGLTDIVCSYYKCTYYAPYPQCIPNCGNGTNCTLYFEIYYGTGSGFVKQTYSDAYYDSSNGNNTSGNITIGDFNGDGKTDILASANGYNVYSFNPNGNDFLLEKVQNGFMQTTQVSYKSIAESGSPYTRTETSSYPLNVTKAAIKVVTSVTNPDGIGGTTTTNYKYENARLHRGGLGFLGFGKVTIDNPTQNAQVVTETEILTPQYLPAVKTVTNNQVVGGTITPLSKTTNTNSVAVNGTRYWMKVDATSSTNSLTGATANSTTSYDGNGNVTYTYSNVNGEESSYTYYDWYGYTVFGSPNFVYGYKQRTGAGYAYNYQQNSYNSQGDVLTSSAYAYDSDANSGWQDMPTTTNTYNPNTGSPLTTSVSSSGLPTKTSSVVYDAKFRYVVAATNPLGQSATKTYDSRWGAVLTEKDVAGLSITYTYDGFGKLVNTLTPQGINIKTQYLWSYDGAYMPKRCYDIVTTIPSKPSTWDTYDVFGRKTVATHENYGDAAHRWVYTYTVTEYDNRGNVSTGVSPVNGTDYANRVTTTYNYDVLNRLTSTASASVNTTIGTTNYTYSYNAGQSTVEVTTPAGQTSSKTTDASGKVISTKDNGGTLTFDYDSRGNQKGVRLNGALISSMTYDSRGSQQSLMDKNAGTTEYTYNAYGQLTAQKDANGNQYSMNYDILGRLTTRTGPEGTTINEYVTSGNGLNAIRKVTSFNGILEEYTYDNLQRVTAAKETIEVYPKGWTT